MRSFDDEMEVRGQQRQRYFEDPNYRKWSDIQSNSTLNPYDATPDHDFSSIICSGVVKPHPIYQMIFEIKWTRAKIFTVII